MKPTQSKNIFLKPLVLSIHLAINTSLILASTQTSADQHTIQYQIAATSLRQALNEFALQSGVTISMNSDQLKGLNSQGLSGHYTIEQGFAELLKQTSYQIKKSSNGYVLQGKPKTQTAASARDMGQLNTIAVNAAGQTSVNRLNNDVAQLPVITVEAEKNGSAEDGYLVKNTRTLGVWGNLSLQDTPYSMSIMSSDFLENTISNTMDKVAKQNPVLKNPEDNSRDGGLATQIRGFGVSSALIDGIPVPNSYYGVGANEVDRIEVISGLSGFLYGSGNVGGVINYALKYPKENPFTKVNIGNNGGKNYFTSIDSSQNINDKLSVRVFGNYQDGETAVENHEDKEKLIGLSFAYKPTSDLDLSLYYAHRESKIGTTPLWIVTGKMPSAENFNTKKGYVPDWASSEVDSDKVEVKANYNFSDNLRLRTAYIYKEADREAPYFYNYLDTNTGSVKNALYWFYEETAKNDGAYAYVDSDFNTGAISHTLTFGGSFGTEKYYRGGTYANWNIPANNINDFNKWTYTVPNQPTPPTLIRENFNTNIVLGDNIIFNEQGSALVGANYASMENKNGLGITQYNKSALTPTLSIIYKPIKELTTYVTYIESLENGSVINNPADTNDGHIFDPLVSTQYEVGAKYAINQDLLLSTALFRIEKANNMTEYFADNGNGKTQKTMQDGAQVNQGLEVLVTGKATDSLTLMGGVTYLSPKVEKTTNKALEGKKATGVSKYQAQMYAEYRLPIESRIFLNGGIYYTGTQWRDNLNTEKLPSYTTVDFGARYETKINGYDTAFRIYGSNLTNEKYWSEAATLGDPRSIAFSIKTQF